MRFINRPEEERLAAIAMGEAVVQLLDEGGRVTSSLLLLKLYSFLLRESEPSKIRAARDAIHGVRRAVALKRRRHPRRLPEAVKPVKH